jgi:hypothetical protein
VVTWQSCGSHQGIHIHIIYIIVKTLTTSSNPRSKSKFLFSYLFPFYSAFCFNIGFPFCLLAFFVHILASLALFCLQYLFFFAACGEEKVHHTTGSQRKSVLPEEDSSLLSLDPLLQALIPLHEGNGYEPGKVLDLPVHNGKDKTNDTPYWILTKVFN